MNTAALRKQYDRARDGGWLGHFVQAATMRQLRPEVLMGIASRESAMGGRQLSQGVFEWLTKPGDGGHAFGLMQIDRRSYPHLVANGRWKEPSIGIADGAKVLAEKRDRLVDRAGKRTQVTDSKTKNVYRFTMPTLEGDQLERVAIASYNCGDWAPYQVAKGRDVDRSTTNKNYSADVLARAQHFVAWLIKDSWVVEPA